MSTYRPCSVDYRLYIGDNIVQLFEKQRSNTFVFINRPPAASGADVIMSIALQKISVPVQRVGWLSMMVLCSASSLCGLSNLDV